MKCRRLFINFFCIVLIVFLLHPVVAQTCEQKTSYYEKLDVPDIRPIISEMKNYLSQSAAILSYDCKRRLHYLVGTCYEITGAIDSAGLHFEMATAAAKFCNSDTALAETYIHASGFYLRRSNLEKAKSLLDTSYKALTRHLATFKKKYDVEGAPSVYVNLEDPITTANKNANDFKKEFGPTQLYLLRSYYQNKGNYLMYSNQPDAAKKNMLLGYQFAKANPLDSTEGNILNNLGLLLSNDGLYLRAVEFLNESLFISEKQKDQAAMVNTLLNLSFCYRKIKKINEAEVYAARARAISQKNGYASFFCRSSSFLARAFSSQNKVKEAEKVMRESIDTALKYQLTDELAYNYRSLAEIMIQHNYKLPEGLDLAQKSRNLILQLGDSSFLNATDITLGNYYYKIGNYPIALKYTEHSIRYSYQFNDFADLDVANKQMADIYTAMNNYQMANKYLLQYDQIKDSLSNTEMKLSMQDLERKYDNQSKKLQISRLEQDQKEKEFTLKQNRNRIRLFVIIAGITLMASLSFLYLNRKLSRQKKEVEKSNQKLEEVTALQNRLFRIIGHDLKSMILPFSRAGKIMQNYLSKNESANAALYAGKLEENAVRLSGTVNNLLFWSVQQLDGFKLKKEMIPVREQVQQVLEPFDELTRLKNIDIINLVKKEETLLTDKEALQIMLRNIVSNAVKFTERGAITIYSDSTPSSYTLFVRDEGIGIQPEKVEKLFKESLQETRSGTQGEKGSGIGFSIIKKLASLNNATLAIDSVPSKGTTVSISFTQQTTD
jgi:signal transduction histidine kinase